MLRHCNIRVNFQISRPRGPLTKIAVAKLSGRSRASFLYSAQYIFAACKGLSGIKSNNFKKPNHAETGLQPITFGWQS